MKSFVAIPCFFADLTRGNGWRGVVSTVFTKNRERLIKHDAVIEFFNEVVDIGEKKDLLSGERFCVDGARIQAWVGVLGCRFSSATPLRGWGARTGRIAGCESD
jgi:hypothetical protein